MNQPNLIARISTAIAITAIRITGTNHAALAANQPSGSEDEEDDGLRELEATELDFLELETTEELDFLELEAVEELDLRELEATELELLGLKLELDKDPSLITLIPQNVSP